MRALRGRSAPVTYGLIGLCCVVFLLGPASGFNPGYGTGERLLAAQRAYYDHWGVIPARLLDGDPAAAITPATSLFIHGSWVHLLGNMLFLHVFGAMAEERMGHIEFGLFYLGCGCVAMFAYAVAHADSGQSLVGASGAISAVLGGFLHLFPRARVTSVFPFLLFLPLRFPAWLVLPFWATLQWLAARQETRGPGVAYLAHVVGFSLGFLYAWARFARTKGIHPAEAEAEGEAEGETEAGSAAGDGARSHVDERP
ncbi:rhomboid family intramembrane serine protease [Streptomyces tsukubensis]|uniref:Rhomboid family intramembrane serine protease n=1 Tax=Streptomyces tsukubensis TaxID=83656 RepID=A0A1V4A7X9_9ACTN|nr:rhomboid family intramembrane serine protease [Streptomyces tsukubensis]